MKPTAPAVARAVYSVNEFALAYGLSRANVYKLWASGRGPQYRMIGAKRLISVADAEAWFAAQIRPDQAAAA